MKQFLALTGRNTRIYLRDKSAIFFSLLSAFIVIGLMIFFLGDMNIEGILGILNEFPGRDYVQDKENAELLVLSWTCAGILSINAVTVSLAMYSGMIKDRIHGRLNAIYTAPVSRFVVTLGYIAAAWVTSVLMCILTLAVTEVYGVIKGLEPYSLLVHFQLLGMIMVNSFVYAALMYLLALIARTEGAWSGFGTVIGTLVGFLGGIYIPIGSLADSISGFMKCTPILYGTSMFRTIMTKPILEETFKGVPDEVLTEYCEVMGIRLSVFDYAITVRDEWILLLVCGIIFFAAGGLMLKYGKKSDR